MKRVFRRRIGVLALLVAAGFVAFAANDPAKPTDAEVESRRVALEVAGAFANDGFKARDGNYAGTLKPGEDVLIQVNLYAGNEYWLMAGSTAPAEKLVVSVFDEMGNPVETDPFQEGRRAAAGFSPEISGPYYVRIQMVEGAPSTFCFLYSYK